MLQILGKQVLLTQLVVKTGFHWLAANNMIGNSVMVLIMFY